MPDWLGSEQVLETVGAVVALIWGLFKGHEWWQWIKDRKLDVLVDAATVAVAETYRTYVREIKAASADGKLTPEEKRAAQQRALEFLIAYLKGQGVDALVTYGEPKLRTMLDWAVINAKSSAVNGV